LDAEDTEFRVWRLALVQRNATGLVALTKLGILTAQVFGRIVLRRRMVRLGGGALGVFLLEMGMTAKCQTKDIARVSGFATAAAGALVWQGL
jgi:hypothetical protein